MSNKVKFESSEIGKNCLYWYYDDGSAWSGCVEFDDSPRVCVNFINLHLEVYMLDNHPTVKAKQHVLDVEDWARQKIDELGPNWLRKHLEYYVI